jgi:hypothetical protein
VHQSFAIKRNAATYENKPAHCPNNQSWKAELHWMFELRMLPRVIPSYRVQLTWRTVAMRVP